MKTKLPFIIFLLLYLVSTMAMAQQPKLEWAQRWNGVANVYESAVALAVDSEGNSYVTGSSRALTSTSGVTTIKYSPTGEQLWVSLNKNLYSFSPVSIAVDNHGGVYILSAIQDSTGQDFGIVRYDAATGEQTWFSRYGEPGEYDSPSAIVVDDKGGVYVTGSIQDSSYACENGTCHTTDFATLRYDAATGNEIWASLHDGGQTDVASDIAVDNEGGIYIIGTSNVTSTGNGISTVRYDAATGDRIWASRYDGGNDLADQAVAIAIDHQGGAFVTGYSFKEDFTSDFVTIRYSAATGEELWASNYDGDPGTDNNTTAIALDNQGGVFVTGTSMEFTMDFPTASYTTVRYDAATGVETWVKPYQDHNESFDVATAITVDNQGGVFITGYSQTSDYINEVFDDDYITLRYNATTGEEEWLSRYDSPVRTPNESPDLAFDIALDNKGGVIVTGESFADFATVRYSASSGEEVWVQRYNRTENVNDFSIAVAVDSEGNSYVTGTSHRSSTRITIVKYSPWGEQLWVAQFQSNSKVNAIAVDNSGGVYVTGNYFNWNSFSYDYLTIRYDAGTGEQTWFSSYNGPASFTDLPSAIAVDNTGGVYVTGYSYNEDFTVDYATVRYEAATGEETWVSRYSGPEGASMDSAAALTVDNKGGVYVTGVSAVDSTNTAFATVRYEAATGEESWASRYGGEDNNTDAATDISVDSKGGVFVTGYSGSAAGGYDYTTIRYEAPTGAESWVSGYSRGDSSDDKARAIAVDTAGGVYVTGTSSADGTSNYATVRYAAATGVQTWASTYNGPAHGNDTAAAIAVDSAGGVYVTGVSYNQDQSADFATVRYDAATGEEVWAERYNSANSNEDVAVDMALGNEGDLIITGYSYSPETLYDFLTVKYSQCPAITEVAVTGSTNVAVGTSNSVYSLPSSGATSYTWTITDIDGSAYTDFTGQGTGSISVDWPDEPNAYKLSVTYGGKEGCPSQTSALYVHVYDPEAGFVSGGGSSDSPTHADYELMQRGGELYWGFVAKYRKEKQVIGSALVILETGPSIFRSTSVEDGSLVISGNSAFFKGKGVLLYQRGLDVRIDNRRFGYLIAATDGQLGTNTGPDRLRLKIWVINEDGTEGSIVYDNQVSCTSASLDNNARPCDAIDKGNVIIHKPAGRSLSSVFSQNAMGEPELKGLQAYPTVFHDRTTLSFATDSDTNYALDLYDLKGALVQRISAGLTEAGKHYEYELSADGLSKGMYLVRLNTGEKVQTVKLVVER
ncbi:SBBP repeat-containing protein [Pontibacter toksunensis]|uniref:SBBP repeat-containing protein n=1 Tax=Pontibacter toksunensis TaxID=1332631 RepID=A0ABW6C198_9BACT